MGTARCVTQCPQETHGYNTLLKLIVKLEFESVIHQKYDLKTGSLSYKKSCDHTSIGPDSGGCKEHGENVYPLSWQEKNENTESRHTL